MSAATLSAVVSLPIANELDQPAENTPDPRRRESIVSKSRLKEPRERESESFGRGPVSPVNWQVEGIAWRQCHINSGQSFGPRKLLVVNVIAVNPTSPIVLRDRLEIQIADIAWMIKMEDLRPEQLKDERFFMGVDVAATAGIQAEKHGVGNAGQAVQIGGYLHILIEFVRQLREFDRLHVVLLPAIGSRRDCLEIVRDRHLDFAGESRAIGVVADGNQRPSTRGCQVVRGPFPASRPIFRETGNDERRPSPDVPVERVAVTPFEFLDVHRMSIRSATTEPRTQRGFASGVSGDHCEPTHFESTNFLKRLHTC